VLSAPACACSRSVAAGSAPEPQLRPWALRPPAVALLRRSRSAPQQFPVWIQQRQTLLASGPSQPGSWRQWPWLSSLPGQARAELPSEAPNCFARFPAASRQGRRFFSILMTCAATHGYSAPAAPDTEGVSGPAASRRFGEHERLSASGPRHLAAGVRRTTRAWNQQVGSCSACAIACSMGHSGLLHGFAPPPLLGSMPRSVRQPGLPSLAVMATHPAGSWSASEAIPATWRLPGVPRDLGWDLPESDLQQKAGIPLQPPSWPSSCSGTAQGVGRWISAALWSPELAKTQALKHAAITSAGGSAELEAAGGR